MRLAKRSRRPWAPASFVFTLRDGKAYISRILSGATYLLGNFALPGTVIFDVKDWTSIKNRSYHFSGPIGNRKADDGYRAEAIFFVK